MSYFENVYKSLLQSIKDNYEIDDISDYIVIDASFLLDSFCHIKLESKKCLGIFTQMYNDSQMGFYSVPYVHHINAKEEYFPKYKMVKPRRQVKETFWQKLGLSSSNKWLQPEYEVSEEYTPKKLILRNLHSVQAQSVLQPSHYIQGVWTKECAWEVFLLDNLEYFLPAFGTGLYKHRKLICSTEDLMNLPSKVRNSILLSDNSLLPHFEYTQDMVRIVVHYFNKWEGLVRWSIPYCTVDEVESPEAICCYNKLIMPGETKDMIVEFDCGCRY